MEFCDTICVAIDGFALQPEALNATAEPAARRHTETCATEVGLTLGEGAFGVVSASVPDFLKLGPSFKMWSWIPSGVHCGTR